MPLDRSLEITPAQIRIAMPSQELINMILSKPNTPMILKEVNTRLREEKEKRGKFYLAIAEGEKYKRDKPCFDWVDLSYHGKQQKRPLRDLF